MTEASPQAHAALTELLRGLFLDAPDLVAFVRASLGSEVAAVLPAAQVSLATYADELVATVQRQQCVPDLLARLAAAKPHAYDHICAAAAAYGIATPAPPGEGVAKAYKPHLPPLPPLGSRVPLRSRVRPKGASAQTVLVSGRLIKQPRLDNPASWLNARYMRVPFHAGLWADELARLEVWYMSDAPVGVIAVAGPGGIGKTRLMLELIARASAAGFTAGFVPPRARPAELAAVLADESRVLAVVDYAETRPSIVTWLAEAAALPDDGRRLRIVLVVRALADWWRFLRDHADSSLDALLARDEPLVLRQDDVGATTRVRVYTEAAMSFAGGAAAPEPPADLIAPRFGKPLYLHMAALAAVEGRTTPVEALLEQTRRRERQFWLRDLRGLDAHDDGAVREASPAIDRAVAAVALGGGVRSSERAARLLALTGVAESLRAGLLRRLVDLYPGTGDPAAPDGYISPLEPDLLASAHVAAVLLAADTPPGWIAAAFAEVGPADVGPGLLLLGRLAGGMLAEVSAVPPERGEAAVRAALTGLLLADLPGRAPIALDAAVGLAERGLSCPLAEVLLECLEHAGTPAIARALADRPCPSAFGLHALELWIHGTVVAHAADASHERRFASRIRLAALWLAERELDAARTLLTEAMADARAWVVEDAAALGPSIIGVGLLGLAAGEVGEHGEALARARDSMRLCEAFAAAAPGEFAEELLLVRMLHALALFRGGSRRAAVAELERVAAGYGQLAEGQSGSFAAELALCEFHRGVYLHDGGRYMEGAAALRRAAEAQRALASDRPGCHLDDLATTLTFLCEATTRLGEHAEALAAGGEAVALWEQMAVENPRVTRLGLALALGAAATAMNTAGANADALAAAKRAVALLRPLAAELPRVHAPLLANALAILGTLLATEGDAAFVEALALLEPLETEAPGSQAATVVRIRVMQGIPRLVVGDATAMQAALQAGRGLDQEAAEGVAFERVIAAISLGAVLVERDDYTAAVAAFDEGLAILATMPANGGRLLAFLCGAGRSGRAWLRWQADDEAGARVDFEASLGPLRAAMPALAETREVLAYSLGAAGRLALLHTTSQHGKARENAAWQRGMELLIEATALRAVHLDADEDTADDYADDVTTLALVLHHRDRTGEALQRLYVAESRLRPRSDGANPLATVLATLAELEPAAELKLARAREAIRLTLALSTWQDADTQINRLGESWRVSEGPARAARAVQAWSWLSSARVAQGITRG
jgi:tetratricopeptide (TPR) repeat protein